MHGRKDFSFVIGDRRCLLRRKPRIAGHVEKLSYLDTVIILYLKNIDYFFFISSDITHPHSTFIT